MDITGVQADARGKIYLRIENGIESHVSVKDALGEVNDAMLGRLSRERSTRRMSSGQGHHAMEYRDGRLVTLVEIDAPQQVEEGPTAWTGEATRIITAKGKRYVVGQIIPAEDRGSYRVTRACVRYWSERDGETSGPTRHASGDAKPGTVGRAIWDAVNP
ncbi:hypothetical protein K388_07427 [Streptomyces sp. KhCrAH-43]|uniref:hypothetical protein n=1 Tax=unclassified Streptomyces TaxID=2593676 RepID=UPI00037B5279|nr:MULTISPECIES: hypothetical protein [unclassified Streptomyces]MYS37169.1 hypothetical protein [Streptomyces sp. SID4920]MYX67180.1 hypothetical protein [Streptomyces sp. SID8373]RAJ43499.1 hypothetical protein K388_07427 [Streptomyces sp. KhCrAH-43]